MTNATSKLSEHLQFSFWNNREKFDNWIVDTNFIYPRRLWGGRKCVQSSHPLVLNAQTVHLDSVANRKLFDQWERELVQVRVTMCHGV